MKDQTLSDSEMIRGLLRKSDKFRRAAEALADVLEIDISKISLNNGQVSAGTHQKKKKAKKAKVAARTTRVEELKKYLEANGPQTAKEIVAGSGVPMGTVASLLTKHGERGEKKRWTWKKK